MPQRANKYPNMTQTTIFGEKKEGSFSSESCSNTIKTVESSLKSSRALRTSDMSEKEHKVAYISPNSTTLTLSNAHSKAAEENNLIKQNPAGKIFLKKKNKIFDKSLKTPKKNRTVYYSSEDEEEGRTKKIYANDTRFRNYYCLNVCKGKFAKFFPFFSCFEWFYGCPLWLYILLFLLFLTVFVTFIVLLGIVLNAPSSATPVTVTRIYNRTWYLIRIVCGGGNANCNGNGQGGTSYQTQLVTQGYMSGQQKVLQTNIIFILIFVWKYLI